MCQARFVGISLHFALRRDRLPNRSRHEASRADRSGPPFGPSRGLDLAGLRPWKVGFSTCSRAPRTSPRGDQTLADIAHEDVAVVPLERLDAVSG